MSNAERETKNGASIRCGSKNQTKCTVVKKILVNIVQLEWERKEKSEKNHFEHSNKYLGRTLFSVRNDRPAHGGCWLRHQIPFFMFQRELHFPSRINAFFHQF